MVKTPFDMGLPLLDARLHLIGAYADGPTVGARGRARGGTGEGTRPGHAPADRDRRVLRAGQGRAVRRALTRAPRASGMFLPDQAQDVVKRGGAQEPLQLGAVTADKAERPWSISTS